MTLFREDAVYIIENERSITSFDLFEIIGNKLIEKNIVCDDFIGAITQREQQFPTGLRAEPNSIAIPHTESEYVKESCICFVRAKSPVVFSEMVDVEKTVDVHYIFFIIMKDRDKQVSVIQDILDVANNQDKMIKIMDASTEHEIFEILSK